MKKIKEILRLKHEAGLSNRAIAGACKISNSTVGEYLRRAEAAGIGWPLGELSEDEVYQKMFGEQTPLPEKAKLLSDWEEVRKELRKKGVTLHLIWIEYIEKYPDGYKHYQFEEYYRRWKKTHCEPSMHNSHIGGERMQVDYAGLKMRVTNPETGEISQVPVFVAEPLFYWMLGFSLASRLRFDSAQEQSTQTTFSLHFWLALVGFLVIQLIYNHLQNNEFNRAVRFKFQIA
jgi:transposase